MILWYVMCALLFDIDEYILYNVQMHMLAEICTDKKG